MGYIYFLAFFTVSVFLGFHLHLAFLKKTLSNLLQKVSKSFDLREKQRVMLEEVASDYFHTMTLEAHAALSSLDRSLVEVKDAITYSHYAMESKSSRFVKESIQRMRTYSRDLEENINKVNTEIEDSEIGEDAVRKIKATWEYKADEIIEMLAEHIAEQSSKQRQLGYRVPTKLSVKEPTSMALEEITSLSD